MGIECIGGEFEFAGDASAKRYMLGRPLGKLELYKHCAPWRRHLLHAPVPLLLARVQRSFWPWHRLQDCRLGGAAAFEVGAMTSTGSSLEIALCPIV